jgi:hypothetical protein
LQGSRQLRKRIKKPSLQAINARPESKTIYKPKNKKGAAKVRKLLKRNGKNRKMFVYASKTFFDMQYALFLCGDFRCKRLFRLNKHK